LFSYHAREQGREIFPSLTLIDSQSIKTTRLGERTKEPMEANRSMYAEVISLLIRWVNFSLLLFMLRKCMTAKVQLM